MKSDLQKRILKWVIGVHVTAVAAAIILPALKSLIHPRPKEVIVTVAIEEGVPEPAAQVTPVEVESLPNPEPVPTPAPKPVPVPEPKPKSKPTPKPKTKWKPVEVKPQNRRVGTKPQPAQPQPDLSRLKSAVESIGGSTSSFATYYTTIRDRAYGVWVVPAGIPYGTSAQGTITVAVDGGVTARRLSRPSGNSAFDQSVQTALNALTRLPRPPADLPSRTITIDFVPQ